MNLKNENGSSLVESIVVMPILMLLTAGVSVSLLWGWARFEISQCLQEMMICERSDFGITNCRRQLVERISRLPGNWVATQFFRERDAVRVRLQTTFAGRSFGFQVREPDPWLQAQGRP